MDGHHHATNDHHDQRDQRDQQSTHPAPAPAPAWAPAWQRHAIDEHDHEPPRWLWPDRVAFGRVTIFQDELGTGASNHAVGVAAYMTRNRPLPDGPDGNPGSIMPLGNAVILAAGDRGTRAVQLLERFDADKGRLTLIEATPDRRITLPNDVLSVARYVRAAEAHLLVIDPVTAFLPAHVIPIAPRDAPEREYDRHDVMLGIMGVLDVLAAASGVAVVVVRRLDEAWEGPHRVVTFVDRLS